MLNTKMHQKLFKLLFFFFFFPNAGSNFHLKTPLKEILISLQPFPQDQHTIGTNCFLSSCYFHLIPSLLIKIWSLLVYNIYYPHFGGSSFTQIANQRICLQKTRLVQH